MNSAFSISRRVFFLTEIGFFFFLNIFTVGYVSYILSSANALTFIYNSRLTIRDVQIIFKYVATNTRYINNIVC